MATDEFGEAREQLARALHRNMRAAARTDLLERLARCEAYGAVHPDGPYDGEINSHSDVAVMRERCAEVPPGCPMWDAGNEEFSVRWVIKWALTSDAARRAGALDELRALPLSDDVHRAMHPLFLEIVDDRDVGDVAHALANLRRRCEEAVGNLAPRPDPTFEGRPPTYIGPRYSLATYFGSLRKWIQGAGPDTGTAAAAPSLGLTSDAKAAAPAESGSARRSRMVRERRARALLLLQERPDWSDAEIARELGVDPSTLSRDSMYKQLAAAARALGYEPTRGRLSLDRDTGDRKLEAVDDSGDFEEVEGEDS